MKNDINLLDYIESIKTLYKNLGIKLELKGIYCGDYSKDLFMGFIKCGFNGDTFCYKRFITPDSDNNFLDYHLFYLAEGKFYCVFYVYKKGDV